MLESDEQGKRPCSSRNASTARCMTNHATGACSGSGYVDGAAENSVVKVLRGRSTSRLLAVENPPALSSRRSLGCLCIDGKTRCERLVTHAAQAAHVLARVLNQRAVGRRQRRPARRCERLNELSHDSNIICCLAVKDALQADVHVCRGSHCGGRDAGAVSVAEPARASRAREPHCLAGDPRRAARLSAQLSRAKRGRRARTRASSATAPLRGRLRGARASRARAGRGAQEWERGVRLPFPPAQSHAPPLPPLAHHLHDPRQLRRLERLCKVGGQRLRRPLGGLAEEAQRGLEGILLGAGGRHAAGRRWRELREERRREGRAAAAGARASPRAFDLPRPDPPQPPLLPRRPPRATRPWP